MRFEGLVGVLLACAMLCGAGYCAAAAAETSVALTLTQTPEAAQQKLGEAFAVAGRAATAKRPGAGDRRTAADRCQSTQEHVLDRSRRRDPQLGLGKLLTADVLAMLEFAGPEPGQKAGKPWGAFAGGRFRRRRRFAASPPPRSTRRRWKKRPSIFPTMFRPRFIRPGSPPSPWRWPRFESKGRFDRLRPLELGVRDLIAARLLVLSGASSDAKQDESCRAGPASLPGFASSRGRTWNNCCGNWI